MRSRRLAPRAFTGGQSSSHREPPGTQAHIPTARSEAARVDALLVALRSYTPWGATDRTGVERIHSFLRRGGGFSRNHLPGHVTASAIVVSHSPGQVLLIRHPRLGRWVQPGGHIELFDGSVLDAARREFEEECGLAILELPIADQVLDVDVQRYPASGRIAAHLHFDIRYLFVAGVDRTKPSECMEARWFELSEIVDLVREPSLGRAIVKASVAMGWTPDATLLRWLGTLRDHQQPR